MRQRIAGIQAGGGTQLRLRFLDVLLLQTQNTKV